jgi:uncharacterized protein YgbK (DUF1537 family)
MNGLLFGAIADDFTGGSDLSGMLSQGGVRTLQLFGLSHDTRVLERAASYSAIVLCLKTRSIEPEDACRQALDALEILQCLGARQIQFKYCSTFDSTERGNIGPVTEALVRAMNGEATIAVPALPVNGRTQYLGHLFVDKQLLSDSPMRYHPLNPMTDSNLVRFLGRQTSLRVGLVDLHALRRGNALRVPGIDIALVDAVEDSDLALIAEGCADMPLVTGGSGLGITLPGVWRSRGWLQATAQTKDAKPQPSGTLILAGSCSAATLEQLRLAEASGMPVIRLDLARLNSGGTQDALKAARPHLERGQALCIRSSAAKEDRTESASHLGTHIEEAFGEIARRAVRDSGITRLIVAGGETSGAVVNALGITAAEITHVIDPGVPALRTLDDPPLHLALKSGNFGVPDFFRKTMRLWEQQA